MKPASNDMKRRHRVALIGNLGASELQLNGQTLRTRLVRDQFIRRLGSSRVSTADTAQIGRRPLWVLVALHRCFRDCEVVCIMLGQRGLRILIPLLAWWRRIYGREVHYLVVGGWLPAFLADKPGLCRRVGKLDGLHVQSGRMERDLRQLGITRVEYLPNFRDFSATPLSESKLEHQEGTELKLVFLSRVIPEKGLALCVQAVKEINSAPDSLRVSLSIYGPVSDAYQQWLGELLRICPGSVNYQGPLEPQKVVGTLSDYDVLLFPTWYSGEGFPGVIVEAYAAGIPVIASDWQDNGEAVESGVTGQLVKTGDEKALREAIIRLLEQPALLIRMKQAARERGLRYHVDEVIPGLLGRLSLSGKDQ